MRALKHARWVNMRKYFDDFTPKEQAEALSNARVWYRLHETHVNNLIQSVP